MIKHPISTVWLTTNITVAILDQVMQRMLELENRENNFSGKNTEQNDWVSKLKLQVSSHASNPLLYSA